MDNTLLIMAAGMGTRYGGDKQIDGMGPSNEILLEYSVYDALEAGFDKVVFIIKRDFENRIRAMIGDRLSRRAKVAYVFQDFGMLPKWYAVPEGRVRPFGTVHAVLCARDVIHEPFAVINADDYYGRDPYRSILNHMRTLKPEQEACMVCYRLKNTVSEYGNVTRGVCQTDGRDKLCKLTETYQIRRFPDGTIRDTNTDPAGVRLDPDCLVSMNLFGYTPWFFRIAEKRFEAFLKGLRRDEQRAEYALPTLTDQMMRDEGLTVDVLTTNAAWFGVTYQEDKPFVQQQLKAMHDSGFYPKTLF
ncbi:MAG: sugar phosphate nucleotidyltransferase [Bacillota bacterium]